MGLTCIEGSFRPSSQRAFLWEKIQIFKKMEPIDKTIYEICVKRLKVLLL